MLTFSKINGKATKKAQRYKGPMVRPFFITFAPVKDNSDGIDETEKSIKAYTEGTG
jgi:hypothetical protein